MSKTIKKNVKTAKGTKAAAKAPKATKPEAAGKIAKAAAAGKDTKPKRVSALDAAARVLKASGQAMRSQELIAAMAEQGLWSSPNGKTPHATLYAAILREINDKGGEARFRKTERGKFEYAG
ncbi:MAG: winged helix-turn-helix domain-containing protein [Phycisphaerae bacterium]